jgi:hypothetical protein
VIIAVTLLGCYFLAIFSGFDRLICWLQPRSLIGWDILYGIALPPQIRLTQTMVTGDTDDTTFGKLFKRGYIEDFYQMSVTICHLSPDLSCSPPRKAISIV